MKERDKDSINEQRQNKGKTSVDKQQELTQQNRSMFNKFSTKQARLFAFDVFSLNSGPFEKQFDFNYSGIASRQRGASDF